MATETTRLLDGFIINFPKEIDELSDIDEIKGLSLEELMPFENDPWWQNLRKMFFLSFWATVIVIFIAACIITVMEYDSCQSGNRNAKSNPQQILIGAAIETAGMILSPENTTTKTMSVHLST